MPQIVPVIMAGGTGSRLWPQSRALYPKQFLPLVNNETMFLNTLQRLDGLRGVKAPIVVANEEHRFLVAEQMRQASNVSGTILLEPASRNTAPAVAIAALSSLSLEKSDDSLLLVLPADHVIEDISAFHGAIEVATKSAEIGRLVTFGILPDYPETGYGYIKAGTRSETGACSVEQFVEKPDKATAEQYLLDEGYYWNSGMFLFSARRYLDELKRWRPDILTACREAASHFISDMDFTRVGEEAFTACPAESIDYAVMEHTSDAVVVPLAAGWSDVGSWHALWEISDKDESGNVVVGDVMLEDSRNNYVRAGDRLVATVGVENLVIAESDDAILVAHRDKVQNVKSIVGSLVKHNRREAIAHRKVYRPWGSYDSVDSGDRFQVKRITVKPGGKLSLQMHHHRAEHWVVVSGTALVTRGEEEILLAENESTYIPLGVRHRLENPGKVDLELIEVQSGSYLGEDDIVRLEDNYGRK
ncbi:MAG: mannose-1-phosphate guanylyltransferase/mannose-6-phosphate isomerase [Endozoicomonas sp.]